MGRLILHAAACAITFCALIADLNNWQSELDLWRLAALGAWGVVLELQMGPHR